MLFLRVGDNDRRAANFSRSAPEVKITHASVTLTIFQIETTSPASCCAFADVLSKLEFDDFLCEYTRENYADIYSDCVVTRVIKVRVSGECLRMRYIDLKETRLLN